VSRTLVSVVVAAVAAFACGWLTNDLTDTAPNCPTEDSCAVDYHNRSWHITELSPDQH
jgi:hypothetical protein